MFPTYSNTFQTSLREAKNARKKENTIGTDRAHEKDFDARAKGTRTRAGAPMEGRSAAKGKPGLEVDVAAAQTPAILFAGIESPREESPIYLGEGETTPLSASFIPDSSPSGTTIAPATSEGGKRATPETPTLTTMNDAEQDTKVVLEDFDFHSKQLREELKTFKNSLMTMSSSATTTPAPATTERVYKQPEINPLHSRQNLSEGGTRTR